MTVEIKMDRTPRYAPEKVMTFRGRQKVAGYIAHPPNAHPKDCPLVKNCTALELLVEEGHSRWYGVEKAYINSELRMVVIGFPAAFEEMASWAKVPSKRI